MNRTDLDNLIALGEGFTVEFKRSGTSNLGRELCAFANATGGVLLVGVTDDGEIVGVNNHNKLKSVIQSIARSIEPPVIVDIERVDTVLAVLVPEQNGKPYSFAGKFYLREGASSQQLGRDEIRNLFFQEGLINFDEMASERFVLDLDLTDELFHIFAKRAKIPTELEPVQALENLHLIRNKKMTNAGAWLLSKDINRVSPSAHVSCALFQGASTVHILDRKNFTSDIYTNFRDVIAYIQAKLNTEFIITGTGRNERLELPVDALREALVNALVHRDYRSTANVQVHIFYDRVEIISPGGLPADMQEKDLGEKSIPRNPLLFSMLYRMDLVEQIGSGIKRIRKLCLDYGIKTPQIIIEDHWVTVVFSRKVVQINSKKNQATPQVTPQVTPQATPQVCRLLHHLDKPRTRRELMTLLGLRDREHFRKNYLQPAIRSGFVNMTNPEKPRTADQRYLLTPDGLIVLASVDSIEEE